MHTTTRRPPRRRPKRSTPIPGAAPNEGGSISLGNWTITTVKGSILTSSEIEEWTTTLSAPLLPEMVFGTNKVEFYNTKSNFSFSFNTLDALKAWDIHGPSLKVAHSAKWTHDRRNIEEDLVEVKEFDWTFTTPYKGTTNPIPESMDCMEGKKPVGLINISKVDIDYEKLRVPEPILFFDEVILFEDELADNGESMLSLKVRVMPSSFYCLMRLWMRVDDVLFRIYDTRVYHQLDSDFILLEHQHREASYKQLIENGTLPTDPTKLALPDIIFPLLNTISKETERIQCE